VTALQKKPHNQVAHLSSADVDMVSDTRRLHKMQQALTKGGPEVAELDYILIDCPPSLGLLTVNMLAAADSIETLLQTARADLRQYNVFTLGQLLPNVKAPVEAEFYLVFAPDSARNAQAVDAKFIKGDESLKPLASQLKTLKYQLVFPDASPTKIVRRGALLCLPKPGVCTFTMISPDLIRSVD